MKCRLVFLLISVVALGEAAARGQAAAGGQAAPVHNACEGAGRDSDACQQQETDAAAAMHEGGIQDGIDEAQKDADVADAAIVPVLAKLDAAQRAAYERAAAAMQRSIDVQVTGDVLHMGGYGSGGLYGNVEHAEFENLVIEYVAKLPSPATPGALAAADADLNRAYRNVLDAAGKVAGMPRTEVPHGMTPEALRAEQRAWIAYRDAFLAFGRTLEPGLPAAAWLLPLTAARADDLRQVYDYAGTQWIAAAESNAAWKVRATASGTEKTAGDRARVAEFFDHQTPVQSAAWSRVTSALDGLAAAHAAAVPYPSLTFKDLQLQIMYGDLYAREYNRTHGFAAPDHATIEAGRAAAEARLNAAYADDLASACLFKPVPGEAAHRTPEGFRAEQRAWLKVRDAWGGFMAAVFPGDDPAGFSTAFTGSRAFFLGELSTSCARTGQAPRER